MQEPAVFRRIRMDGSIAATIGDRQLERVQPQGVLPLRIGTMANEALVREDRQDLSGEVRVLAGGVRSPKGEATCKGGW